MSPLPKQKLPQCNNHDHDRLFSDRLNNFERMKHSSLPDFFCELSLTYYLVVRKKS